MSLSLQAILDQSGDSCLLDYAYRDGCLILTLEVPDLDRIVSLRIDTGRVVADVPLSTTKDARVCFIELLRLGDHLVPNNNGFFVPAGEFQTFMEEVRQGYFLGYGRRSNSSPLLFRLSAHKVLLACLVENPDDISFSLDAALTVID